KHMKGKLVMNGNVVTLNQLVLLEKPSFPGLAYLLRHKELWPEGFVWDFCRLRDCAWGLASRYWGFDFDSSPKEIFGLGVFRSWALFCGLWAIGKGRSAAITPEMVAARIDRMLAAPWNKRFMRTV